jgi:uncharacterized protein
LENRNRKGENMELLTTYFEKPGGEENTAKTFSLAKTRADALGIKTFIVASTTGATAVKAMDALKGYRVIIVTHTAGFREPNSQEFTEENRKIVEKKGGAILTAAHALGGIQRSLATPTPGGHTPPSHAIGDIVAMTLRMFSQGTKVCCECAAMAADAGLVRLDEEVICIGGTGRGADTALVIKPDNLHRFFGMRVKEIICKPRL